MLNLELVCTQALPGGLINLIWSIRPMLSWWGWMQKGAAEGFCFDTISGYSWGSPTRAEEGCYSLLIQAVYRVKDGKSQDIWVWRCLQQVWLSHNQRHTSVSSWGTKSSFLHWNSEKCSSEPPQETWVGLACLRSDGIPLWCLLLWPNNRACS